jgi:hypothetical protein
MWLLLIAIILLPVLFFMQVVEIIGKINATDFEKALLIGGVIWLFFIKK